MYNKLIGNNLISIRIHSLENYHDNKVENSTEIEDHSFLFFSDAILVTITKTMNNDILYE